VADKLQKILKNLPAGPAGFVEPMLLRSTDALPEGEGWQYELKFDGFRCQIIKEGDRVSLISRQRKPLTTNFKALAEAARGLSFRSGVLDGEVVALETDGRPSFQLLQNHASAACQVVFYAFDLLNLEGRRTTGLPLHQRRDLLEQVLTHRPDCFHYSTELKGNPAKLVEQVKRLKLEGIVAKRRDSLYLPGNRKGAWLKYKVHQEEEFIIGGYTTGLHPFESLLVGHVVDGQLLFCGKVKAGFIPRTRAVVFEQIRGSTVSDCPFENLPQKTGGKWGYGLTKEDMAQCIWLEPSLQCRVGFVEWTDAGHLRHSRFISARSS
jgi:bifunctional non-homologous end joining protein LigD